MICFRKLLTGVKSVNADLDEDGADKAGSEHFSRKVKAHMFIDDRNLGGLPDWGTIYKMISKRMTWEQLAQEQAEQNTPAKKPWWKF